MPERHPGDAVAVRPSPGPELPPGVRRRFEAMIVWWAALRSHGSADELSSLVVRACDAGIDVAVMADSRLTDTAAALQSRPSRPGRLFLCLTGGDSTDGEIFEIDERGFRLVDRRGATDRIGVERVGDLGAAGWFLADLWRRGVNPGEVLWVGVPAGAGRAPPTRVAVEPQFLAAVLTDQVDRRRRGDIPDIEPAPGWQWTVEEFDPQLTRVHESLLTLADGHLGTRGAPLVGNGATTPAVFYAGAYEKDGADTELAHLPLWNRFPGDQSRHPRRRVLDLHSGLLREDGPHRSLRFSSLARPATVAVRARGEGLVGRAASRERIDGIVAAAFADRDLGGVVERLGAYDPHPGAAESALSAAEAAGFDTLLREHRAAWARRWQDADVVVDGDPDLQLAIRLSLFHLMGSVGDRGEAAVGARGLSGSAYRGHVFWDSDVFVLPFLAATHPPAARAMLMYRINRLPAAKAAAREIGRDGARFPWESAAEGTDVTPTTALLPTGDLVTIHTGELEEHIVACVAWAAACYCDWTGDTAFANGPGRDLLVESARYWASRAIFDRFGRSHIDGVVGPDEYHHTVDDNAFTNVMARWNLRRAAALPGVDEPERATWLEVADALVDGYDPQTRLYEQFAGFFGLTPIVIAQIAPQRPIAADLLLGFDRTARSQVVKQPDVLMLHHLVPDEVETGSLAPNLDFYEPRTAHGSSLSPAIHASLLARAGRVEPALSWLRIASRIDVDDLTGTTAGGLHLATMGGLWQAVAYGFAGVRVQADRVVVAPHLPSRWRALELGLRFHDRPFRLRIESGGVEIDSDAVALRRSADHWEVVPK